ncbi:5'-methylthioadenosine/S-adenosylhomocysteine nucleosidase family protein [Streptomyces sp. NPDC001340]
MILTALQVEYDAVSARLEGLTRSSEKGTVFERGRLPGTPWTVVLAQTGPGNDNAALVTQHAYDLYRPRVLLFVGVAGGLKDDIRIGDVVIGERIYDYREKQSPRGDHYRPRGWEAPWRLVQHVQRMTFGPDVAGRVRVAPIASGNVVLDRETSELGEVLRGNYDDAVAIEMESAGVCRAAHLIGGLDTLTIRGISDKADGGKGRADAGGSQEIAAWCAAAVAVRILASLAAEQETPTLPDAGSVGGAPGAGSASQELLGASAAGTDESGPPKEGEPPVVPPLRQEGTARRAYPHHPHGLWRGGLGRSARRRPAQGHGRCRSSGRGLGAEVLQGVSGPRQASRRRVHRPLEVPERRRP